MYHTREGGGGGLLLSSLLLSDAPHGPVQGSFTPTLPLRLPDEVLGDLLGLLGRQPGDGLSQLGAELVPGQRTTNASQLTGLPARGLGGPLGFASGPRRGGLLDLLGLGQRQPTAVGEVNPQGPYVRPALPQQAGQAELLADHRLVGDHGG